jgi:hypothetical protein
MEWRGNGLRIGDGFHTSREQENEYHGNGEAGGT